MSLDTKEVNGATGWIDNGRQGRGCFTSSLNVVAPSHPCKIAPNGRPECSVPGCAVSFIRSNTHYFISFCKVFPSNFFCNDLFTLLISKLSIVDYHPDLGMACLPYHDGATGAIKHWRGLRFEGAIYERPLIQENTLYVRRSKSILRHVEIR